MPKRPLRLRNSNDRRLDPKRSTKIREWQIPLVVLGLYLLGRQEIKTTTSLSAVLADGSSLRGLLSSESPKMAAVIVHCKEGPEKTAWYSQIPLDWNVSIYETCGEIAHVNYSHPFKNAGSEECTAYLDYILQNYDNLPDIVTFLQTDTFRGYGNKDKVPWFPFNVTAHTCFTNFSQLQSATYKAIVAGSARFLHFGWGFEYYRYDWGADITKVVPYAAEFFTEMWGILAKSKDEQGNYINHNHNFWGKILGRPGAVFAVHKERIRANPKYIYQQLKDKIMSGPPDHARRRCCSLENTWHILFHEPARLPNASAADYCYEGYGKWPY